MTLEIKLIYNQRGCLTAQMQVLTLGENWVKMNHANGGCWHPMNGNCGCAASEKQVTVEREGQPLISLRR